MIVHDGRVRPSAMRGAWALALGMAAAAAAGCTSVKMTGTPRTATEQLLLTGAWDTALASVDFSPLSGSRVFLDGQYVTVVDKDWVLSSIRRAMARQGVLLENARDKARYVVEPSIAAYGTEERNCTTGLPQTGVVPTAFGTAALSGAGSSGSSGGSALTLAQTNKQDAVVKGVLFAYDAKSGQMVWESCPLLSAHGVRDHFFLGAGPYRTSSLPDVQRFPGEAQANTRRRLFGR